MGRTSEKKERTVDNSQSESASCRYSEKSSIRERGSRSENMQPSDSSRYKKSSRHSNKSRNSREHTEKSSSRTFSSRESGHRSSRSQSHTAMSSYTDSSSRPNVTDPFGVASSPEEFKTARSLLEPSNPSALAGLEVAPPGPGGRLLSNSLSCGSVSVSLAEGHVMPQSGTRASLRNYYENFERTAMLQLLGESEGDGDPYGLDGEAFPDSQGNSTQLPQSSQSLACGGMIGEGFAQRGLGMGVIPPQVQPPQERPGSIKTFASQLRAQKRRLGNVIAGDGTATPAFGRPPATRNDSHNLAHRSQEHSHQQQTSLLLQQNPQHFGLGGNSGISTPSFGVGLQMPTLGTLQPIYENGSY